MKTKTLPNAFVVWLLLVTLTAVTWAVGESGYGGVLVVTLLLASIGIKGQLVADAFMGMRRVTCAWRWVVSAWLLLVVALIGLAYWMGAN